MLIQINARGERNYCFPNAPIVFTYGLYCHAPLHPHSFAWTGTTGTNRATGQSEQRKCHNELARMCIHTITPGSVD
jgi:hypothetical protein